MTASELLFVPETHEYRTPDGVSVPSVTQILRGVGVSADFKAVAPGTLEYRRQLGTAVHADCHAYDDNDLDWATVDVRVKPYVEAWCQFREAKALRANGLRPFFSMMLPAAVNSPSLTRSRREMCA